MYLPTDRISGNGELDVSNGYSKFYLERDNKRIATIMFDTEKPTSTETDNLDEDETKVGEMQTKV